MPYTVKKNDSGEFCVHKQDEDGEAEGKSLGCHETKKEASAQIGAIESEEKDTDKKSVYVTDASKALSLDQLRWKIIEEWEEEFGYASWVSEVYFDDGYLIVCQGKKYFKVPFSGEVDSFEFAPINGWKEVELPKEWVEKSISLKNRMN